MVEPYTFICRCGAEFTTGAPEVPAGWQRIDGQLLCTDCAPDADRALQQPGSLAGPTVVRVDGSDSATSILLRSGVYLDLADPDCTRITAPDIAAGLRQFRFAAQTEQPYTIAQHSLLVLQLVDRLAVEQGDEQGHMLRQCALLHDAPKAFLHDITSPLKSLLPDYRQLETMFEKRFAHAFGLKWTEHRKQLVKQADRIALAIEKRVLLGISDPSEREPQPWWRPLFATVDRVWSADEAEARFLEALAALSKTAAQRIAA